MKLKYNKNIVNLIKYLLDMNIYSTVFKLLRQGKPLTKMTIQEYQMIRVTNIFKSDIVECLKKAGMYTTISAIKNDNLFLFSKNYVSSE